MKIVIAGYGYVGKAIDTILRQSHETYIVDPAINSNKINDIDYDAMIICVSTPQSNDGSCNMQNVFDCIEESADKPILIKSTISLEGWQELTEKYSSRDITFSPEFLRAKTATQDFATQKIMYLSDRNPEFWIELFNPLLTHTIYKSGSAEELILAKYFRNSFLATKVNFFNQIYDLCEKINNISYDTVRQYITDDERIGEGHSKVTNERGFGGHCFPKDVQAILRTADKKGMNLSLIREAANYNKVIKKVKEKS